MWTPGSLCTSTPLLSKFKVKSTYHTLLTEISTACCDRADRQRQREVFYAVHTTVVVGSRARRAFIFLWVTRERDLSMPRTCRCGSLDESCPRSLAFMKQPTTSSLQCMSTSTAVSCFFGRLDDCSGIEKRHRYSNGQ